MGKRCCTCKKWLSLKDFSKDKDKLDGLKGQCRICKKEYDKKYHKENREEIAKKQARKYQKNKEIILEQHARYYQNNKKKMAKYFAEYRKNNKEKIVECAAKCYQKNKKRINVLCTEYRKNNKDKFRIYSAKFRQNNKEKRCVTEALRRATKLNQTSTDADFKIIQLYYTVCNETNEILGDTFFHVDHIQPLSKGGLHHEDNLQILESHLNLQKNDKWPLTSDERLKYAGVTL